MPACVNFAGDLRERRCGGEMPVENRHNSERSGCGVPSRQRSCCCRKGIGLTEEEAPGARAQPGGSGEAPGAGPDQAPEQARASRRPGRAVWVVASIAAAAGLLPVPSWLPGAFANQSGPNAGAAAGKAGDDTLNDPDPVNQPGQAPLPMNAPSIGAQGGSEPTPASSPAGAKSVPATHHVGTQHSAPAAHQAPQLAPEPAPTPAPQPVVMFRAVGGEDCTHTSNQGYYRIGTYSDGA